MSEKLSNVVCVVVTYNRLPLLKECVESLKQQSYPLSRIIIVDNHSTDGTADYLSQLSDDPIFHIVTMEKNVGGAGGFSRGIKEAALAHADWIWLMDDDTTPLDNALEQMMPYTRAQNIGFVCSKVLWTDGSLHQMNIVHTDIDQSNRQTIIDQIPESNQNFYLTNGCSFVSILINGEIPWKLGLPYKEFFIWNDDVEYTDRITSNGYYGIYAVDSIAIHKTEANYESSLYTIPASAAWKLFYGVRNDCFLRRKRRGWLKFFFSHLNKFRVHAHHIKKRHLPKAEERLLLKANRRALLAAFVFAPEIEYLTE